MRMDDRKLEGDQEVRDELQLNGMITGSATVVAGGYLLLSGMVCGDLIVKPGGRATVNGMVEGSVRNDGKVDIYGMVHGRVEGLGQTFIDANAAVMGSPKRR